MSTETFFRLLKLTERLCQDYYICYQVILFSVMGPALVRWDYMPGFIMNILLSLIFTCETNVRIASLWSKKEGEIKKEIKKVRKIIF